MAYEPVDPGGPDDIPRLSMLIWGEAGCGKTTLAATAPGKKLWLLFDPDGTLSINDFPNFKKIDLSKEDERIVSEFKKTNPFGLRETLTSGAYNTLVVDSLTRCSEHALRFVIPTTYKATAENPTPAGYGARNLIVVNFMHYLLRLTAQLNINIIFLTHEGAPDKSESGQIMSVGMMLGGQLPNVVSKDIGEVWNMADITSGTLKGRRIGVRPERQRSPMKSRMFDLSTDATGFNWQYNPATKQGLTLEQLWNKWKDGGYAKLRIP